MAELLLVVGQGAGFEDGTTRFWRTRHAKSIREFTRLSSNNNRLVCNSYCIASNFTFSIRSLKPRAAHTDIHAPNFVSPPVHPTIHPAC